MWTWQPVWSTVGGTVLFALVFVPALVWQYQRWGRPSVPRLVALGGACVYGVALVAYTLLPLPAGDLDEWCARHAAGHNLDPWQMVRDIAAAGTGVGVLRSFALAQVVLNVVLFVPWGVVGRGLLGWGVLRTTLSGLLASLLIETVQLTGAFGLIGCSYRVGDVDDVILNTTGALLGAVAAGPLLRRLPDPAALQAHRLVAAPVTVRRRWLGMLVDAGLDVVLGAVLVVGYRVLLRVSGRPLPTGPTVTEAVLSGVLPWLVVFVLPALTGDGASFGQRLAWLGPRWPDRIGRPSVGHRGVRLWRATCVGGVWALLGTAADWPGPALAVPPAALAGMVAVAAVLAVPLTRGRRGLSGVLSGAEVVDVRGVPARPAPAG